MTTKRALVAGFIAASATLVVAMLIPKTMALELLTAILWSIAAVYLGFALMDGRIREMLVEAGNIGLTFALALLGLWVAPYWLALGYFAHGLWDAVHHPRGIQTTIPHWYAPFCLLYDWMIAGFILVWWQLWNRSVV